MTARTRPRPAAPSGGWLRGRGLSPRLRRSALIVHVVASVGWLGLDVGLLAFGITGLAAGEPEVARAAYIAMGVIGPALIVPFSVASLLTGVLVSLGSSWGLVRHYWVVVKFVLTSVATVAVIMALRPNLAEAAGRALDAPATFLGSSDAGGVRFEVVVAPSVALCILSLATVLSVYKPWGRTPYGRRRPLRAARPASNRRAGEGLPREGGPS